MNFPSGLDLDSGLLEKLLGLAELLPPSYAEYRPLLADALLFFLLRLSPARQQAIYEAQRALPARASRSRRLLALFRLCPTLHKLGQVVAHDKRLSTDLRRRLQELETLVPTDSLAAIRPVLEREIGHISGMQVGRKALAEASVAVVVPFVWRPSAGMPAQRGVFKVLRPGVQERLNEELPIWSALGAYLEERCFEYGLPVFNYRNTLESVARLLANEVSLDREQIHLSQAADFYSNSADVLIPRLFPFSTASVTAMERIDGCKVTDQDLPPDKMRERAERIVRAMLAQPFWGSDAAPAVFHGDPHAGNLMATPDGRLAILDWALTTHITKVQCEAVIQLILGALTLNEQRVCAAIALLGEPLDEAQIQVAVAEAIRQVQLGTFPGFDWLTALMDRLGSTSALRFPEDVILFRKALLTLSSVVADVSSEVRMDSILVMQGVTRFAGRLMWRPWAAPFSRATVGAHLSNADLLALWAELPAIALRYLAVGNK